MANKKKINQSNENTQQKTVVDTQVDAGVFDGKVEGNCSNVGQKGNNIKMPKPAQSNVDKNASATKNSNANIDKNVNAAKNSNSNIDKNAKDNIDKFLNVIKNSDIAVANSGDIVKDKKASENVLKENKSNGVAENCKVDANNASLTSGANVENNGKKEKKKKVKYHIVNGKKVPIFDTPFEHTLADSAHGLTQQLVDERLKRGLVNQQPNVVTKSYFRIFTSNVFTLFNALNFFLATLIL
ncbi:MAG: hypothetical protein RR348_02170, partial [Clostridia bacterium]